jgi:tetratricopeptide (TPR) repeat protein
MSRGFKSTADFLPYRNCRSEIQGICMTSEAMDWDEEIPDDPEEEYLALVRALKRKKGFGLFFVRCSQKEGKQIIERVKQDIPQKTIEVLRFIEPIDNLYNRVANFANRDKIDIFFIQGIEYSLYEYELKTFGEITKLYFNNFTSVPRILSPLNQQRERFRDDFDICFVFLLCPFALKYFIQRAPDFFDWKSSVFDFPTHPDVVEEESSRLLLEGDYEKYLNLTPQERVKKIIEIQDLLAADYQTPRANLLFELGNLLVAAKEYEGAIASYDQALKFKPDLHQAWNNKACSYALQGNIEQAIENLQQAINLSPDEYREMAKTDSYFDSIREDERFQLLIQEPLPSN